MPNFIDTHTHLSAPEFDLDREAVIQRALEAGVSCFISIGAGYGLESANKAIILSEQYQQIFATVGIHPHDAAKVKDVPLLEELATHPRVVAIGETGLDYYRELAPRTMQEECFRSQIELAHKVKKPIIIHSRAAGEDSLRILKEMEAQKIGGVFHCYSENIEFAKKLRAINFLISIPGNVTYKNSQELKDVVKTVPITQIMLETDAPFLSPQVFRGKRCESAFMLETAKEVALIRGMSLEELAIQTSENARRLFKLP